VSKWKRYLIGRYKHELEEAKREMGELFEAWGGDPRHRWEPPTHDWPGENTWSTAKGRAAYLESHMRWLESQIKKLEAEVKHGND